MATLIEQDVRDGVLDTTRVEALFKSAYAREFEAQIFGINKTKVELRAYVTDRNGIVVFDSTGQSVGKDFSQWRDVRLTLQGEYGARTTPDIPGDNASSVMYMAAPMRCGSPAARSLAASPWASRCKASASLWPPRAAARCMPGCCRCWPCWCWRSPCRCGWCAPLA